MPNSPIHLVPATESLDDLVKRIADRDQAAFGRLYRRLVRPVFAQVLESLGTPARAVPVTRAVFVEVWRLAPLSVGTPDKVLAWVTAIAARRAAERLRELAHQSPTLGSGDDGHLDNELLVALGAGTHADVDPAVDSGRT